MIPCLWREVRRVRKTEHLVGGIWMLFNADYVTYRHRLTGRLWLREEPW